LYEPPSDPCGAVSAATRKMYELRQPEASTFPYAGTATSSGVPALTDTVRCTWVVDNPGKGPNGRPNQLSVTLDFQVPTAEDVDEGVAMANAASTGDVTPEQMAQVLFDSAPADLEGESAGVTTRLKRREPVDGLGDSAYTAVLAQKDQVGRSTVVVVALRAANAHVMVTHSGADLQIDPSLPQGLQLVTTPVPPRRLKPAAEAVARDALEGLG
jgi:hypothetical protein